MLRSSRTVSLRKNKVASLCFSVLATISMLINSILHKLLTPHFSKVNRLREVENGSSKAWIKVERVWLNTRDGQMNTRRRQSGEKERERGEEERVLTYFNYYSCAAVESPAVHALRP